MKMIFQYVTYECDYVSSALNETKYNEIASYENERIPDSS